MKHFLLTRWNLPGLTNPEEMAPVIAAPEWRRDRLRLFARYCLPSVQAQTTPDFTWLFLVFAPETSSRDIARFRNCDPRLEVIPVEDPASPGTAEARQEIEQRLRDDEWVLTSRVDSDDLLHRNHFARVRASYAGERTFVQFLRGYYYDIRTDSLCELDEDQNAFLSLFEPASNLETVITWSHTTIRQEGHVLSLQEPGWMALVHDRNTSTSLIGAPVTGRAKRLALAEFGLPTRGRILRTPRFTRSLTRHRLRGR